MRKSVSFGAAIAALVLCMVSAVALPNAKPATTDSILKGAIKTAKSSHKPIFVIFHASWCGWCKKLEAAMDQPEFKKMFEKTYVLVRLDVLESKDKQEALENPGGVELMKSWGGEKSGLPFYVFLDENGTKVADSNAMPKEGNIGYPGAPEEIVAFDGLLKKSAPKLAVAQREKFIEYLKKNAPPASGH
jgi:thiol:disulfide interchange protein